MSNSDPEANPFQITSSRALYQNPWIQLIEHQIINPAGKPGIYGVVRFKNRAVGVVPFDNGDIWLVGQYRLPLEKYSWEIPEGGSPEGEELLETARRELKEETGLVATTFEPLLQMHLSNSVTDEFGSVFLARGLRQEKSSPEETERLQVRKTALEDAYAEVEAGRITDSLSVAAIYKLMLMKVQGKI